MLFSAYSNGFSMKGCNHMNGYMTCKEASIKWGISERQVQAHCKNGRIPGVSRIGRNWIIPENTQKPVYKFVCDPIVETKNESVDNDGRH